MYLDESITNYKDIQIMFYLLFINKLINNMYNLVYHLIIY